MGASSAITIKNAICSYFEQRHYKKLVEEKFSLMDSVHEVVNPSGIHASVSIGVGRDGASFEENYNFAVLSTERALSRGGDQAVIKTRFNFEFFGGRGAEIETRTKVKSRVIASAAAELIKTSGQVLIMGHKFGDMDSVAPLRAFAASHASSGAEPTS